MPTLKTELPRYYGTQRRPGLVRIKAEEEAIIWLWAKPSIFPWQRPRAWLFPPVTGKTRWPGDFSEGRAAMKQLFFLHSAHSHPPWRLHNLAPGSLAASCFPHPSPMQCRPTMCDVVVILRLR